MYYFKDDYYIYISEQYDRLVRLYRYVIASAIQDILTYNYTACKANNQNNIRYIFESEDFIKVCGYAELNPDYVRKKFSFLKNKETVRNLQIIIAKSKKTNNTRLIRTIMERLDGYCQDF